jgi:hypothetical protein
MFFYTSLFIASLIVALVVLWLYHALADVGKAVYRAILPSSKGNSTDHLTSEAYRRTTINDTPTPWGWGEHAKPSQAARTAKIAPSDSAPWGWPGNKNKIRERGQQYDLNGGAALTETAPEKKKETGTGWPYREEKFDFAGKSYKVSRKASPKKTNLRNTGTPWGW